MPSWLLRMIAVGISASSMAGSTGYVLYHPKNPAAPLQPVVVDPVGQDEDPAPAVTLATARPSPTARPTPQATQLVLAQSSPTGAPRSVIVTLPPVPAPVAAAPTSRPTPLPTVRLSSGVRATQLPKVTTTHTS